MFVPCRCLISNSPFSPIPVPSTERLWWRSSLGSTQCQGSSIERCWRGHSGEASALPWSPCVFQTRHCRLQIQACWWPDWHPWSNQTGSTDQMSCCIERAQAALMWAPSGPLKRRMVPEPAQGSPRGKSWVVVVCFLLFVCESAVFFFFFLLLEMVFFPLVFLSFLSSKYPFASETVNYSFAWPEEWSKSKGIVLFL